MPEALIRKAALALGPLLAVLAWLILPAEGPHAIAPSARACASIAVLMGTWWLSEAVPISVTALLPIVLFPLLGVLDVGSTTARYAHPVIFLFMGGFLLALSMQRWGLHRRIALITILIVGTQPKRMIAGFMVATAILSMFVSNTATAIMLIPIALSVADLVAASKQPSRQTDDFATCLLLAVAYAASIGGLGTLIGTPPNAVLAGVVSDRLGREIGFAQWMLLGIPLVAVFLPIAWLYLVLVAFPRTIEQIDGGKTLIRNELASLGPMSRAEWTTLIAFFLTAFLWIFRPIIVSIASRLDLPILPHLDDTTIAMLGGLSLFLVPAGNGSRVMDWETAEKLPWGILLLFGGGLALAEALGRTGVDASLGSLFTGMGGIPLWLMVAVMCLGIVFLSELASNTAVATAMLPVLLAAAGTLGIPPLELMIPAVLAASCGFMLPVATPPNAIAFASGRITIAQMARHGFVVNILGVLLITVAAFTLVPMVFA